MKTLFIAAGDITWASSRMRCWWPAKYMDADVQTWAELQAQGGISQKYDHYIFQKYADPGICQAMLDAGKRVWWDICDPIHWFSPMEARKVADTVNGVVCSSQVLAEDFERWSGRPAYRIPDRLELSCFPKKREHTATKPVKFIWFGLAINRIALAAACANLDRMEANGYPYELTIFDNQPELPTFASTMPVTYQKWSLETENEVLASHDIALLPPYPGPWGRVKSNNKRLTAYASGLPVTDGLDYESLLALVRDPGLRSEKAAECLKIVERDYPAERSARDWQQILDPKPVEVFIGCR